MTVGYKHEILCGNNNFFPLGITLINGIIWNVNYQANPWACNWEVSYTGRCVPQRFTIQDPFHFNKYSQEHFLKGIFTGWISHSQAPPKCGAFGGLKWKDIFCLARYCCNWRLGDAKASWSFLSPPWKFVPWSENNSQGLPWQATSLLKAIRKESGRGEHILWWST